MEPPKDWFTIVELAKRWRWARVDIEHLLATGKLICAYRLTKDVNVKKVISDGKTLIHSLPAKTIILFKGKFIICEYDNILWNRSLGFGVGTLDNCIIRTINDFNIYHINCLLTIHKNEIVVMLSEVLDFEKEHGIRIVNGIRVDDDPAPQVVSPPPAIEHEPQPVTVQDIRKNLPCFDPEHPYYSSLIPLIFKTWMHAAETYKPDSKKTVNTFREIAEKFLTLELEGKPYNTDGVIDCILQAVNSDVFSRRLKRNKKTGVGNK